MKAKIVPFLSLVFVVALTQPLHAQHGGFAIAIAPPRAPIFIPQTILPQPNLGFHIQPPPIVTNTHQFHGHRGHGGRGTTIIAPGATIIVNGGNAYSPYSVYVPPVIIDTNTAVIPGSFVTQPRVPDAPGTPRHPNQPGARQNALMPAAGMSRAAVIHEFGNPPVSVVTREGETLHFSNGLVVVLQNGVVVAH